jgi:uncharacterized protein (TIGR02246 family)
MMGATRNEREEIETLNKDWLAAEARKDVAKLLTLVTDDVVFLPINWPAVVGKQAVEAMYRVFFDRFGVVEHSTSISEVRVCHDWAFVWGSEKLILTPKTGGASVELNGHGMSILQRDAHGAWRFARGINNLSPKPALISPHK